MDIDHKRSRYPYCIVWTPIPCLTWFLPFLGHLGIGTSSGVIMDFSMSYMVSVDDFAFGKPTKYWQLTPENVPGGQTFWDEAVTEASEIYRGRMHNICFDNCHSHVATALNIMKYDNSSNWNMVKLALLMVIHSKYVGPWAFLKTWVPFFIVMGLIICACIFSLR